MIHFLLLAQPENDKCDNPMLIDSVANFCSSSKNLFTNIGATQDIKMPNTCINAEFKNGVWFNFVAIADGITITVLGSGEKGTMEFPNIFIYDGCNKIVACSPGKTQGIDELFFDKLQIGNEYLIMVDSKKQGTFALCIKSFTPVPNPESDCINGVVLCDKSAFGVQSLIGAGNDTREVDPNSCVNNEFQSAWYKWTCDQSGTLTFVLTPNNIQSQKPDDLDWALYELPNGIKGCGTKSIIRCGASGEDNTVTFAQWIKCHRETGLKEGESDINEEAGCSSGQNAFLKPVDMVKGRSYALIVNNYSRSGLGFSITFGGTGTFLGPNPDFDFGAVNKFECDKTVTIKNISKSPTDSIASYIWNFGSDATPATANTFGPHDITFASFGEKNISLIGTSSRGCRVVKTKKISITSCCKDFKDFKSDGSVTNLKCATIKAGEILGIASGGTPRITSSGIKTYEYSLDSIKFRTNPNFINLAKGTYNIFARDLKGCVVKKTLIINSPDSLKVDAGPAINVELGDGSTLNGSAKGGTGILTATWSPKDSIANLNQLVTPIIPLYKERKYALTVVDANGCVASDTVLVKARITIQIFSPNIIKASLADRNGTFLLEGGKAVKNVKFLRVYDRWGNKVYEGQDMDIKNLDEGWNGKINDNAVVPGVFTWIATVTFIDNNDYIFKGDVTVIE
jgi:hypothetical protein